MAKPNPRTEFGTALRSALDYASGGNYPEVIGGAEALKAVLADALQASMLPVQKGQEAFARSVAKSHGGVLKREQDKRARPRGQLGGQPSKEELELFRRISEATAIADAAKKDASIPFLNPAEEFRIKRDDAKLQLTADTKYRPTASRAGTQAVEMWPGNLISNTVRGKTAKEDVDAYTTKRFMDAFEQLPQMQQLYELDTPKVTVPSEKAPGRRDWTAPPDTDTGTVPGSIAPAGIDQPINLSSLKASAKRPLVHPSVSKALPQGSGYDPRFAMGQSMGSNDAAALESRKREEEAIKKQQEQEAMVRALFQQLGLQ